MLCVRHLREEVEQAVDNPLATLVPATEVFTYEVLESV